MLIIDGSRRIVGDLPALIASLESLLADLARFENGDLPTTDEIAAAPWLNPVAVAIRPGFCLVGGNHGHPIRTGAAIRTSALWVLARELGWARTFSRLYRIGPDFLDGTP